MTLKLRKVFIDDTSDTEVPQQCPECAKKGDTQYLRFHFISLSESVEKCSHSTCMYPFRRFRYRNYYDQTVYRYERHSEQPTETQYETRPEASDNKELLDNFNLNWLGSNIEPDVSDDIQDFEDYSFGESGLAKFLEMANESTSNTDDINAIIADICKGSDTMTLPEDGYSLCELQTVCQEPQTKKSVELTESKDKYCLAELSCASETIQTENPNVCVEYVNEFPKSISCPIQIVIETPEVKPIITPIVHKAKRYTSSSFIRTVAVEKKPEVKELEEKIKTNPIAARKSNPSSIKLPAIFKEKKKLPTTNFKFNIVRPVKKNVETTKSVDAETSSSSCIAKPFKGVPISPLVSGCSTPKSDVHELVTDLDLNSNLKPRIEHHDLYSKHNHIHTMDSGINKTKIEHFESDILAPIQSIHMFIPPSPIVSEISERLVQIDPIPSATSTPRKFSSPTGVKSQANSANKVKRKKGRKETGSTLIQQKRLYSKPDRIKLAEPRHPCKNGFQGFNKRDLRLARERCCLFALNFESAVITAEQSSTLKYTPEPEAYVQFTKELDTVDPDIVEPEPANESQGVDPKEDFEGFSKFELLHGQQYLESQMCLIKWKHI